MPWLCFDVMGGVPWILYPGSWVRLVVLPDEYSACHDASLFSAC